MASVRLQGVRKLYRQGVQEHVAVHGIDLDVADGEFVVLVGPSGCGKSTTLRMIAGLESITAGTVMIGDRIVNDTPPKARDLAMVFQSYALYPHMTVEENLGFALRLRGLPRGEIERRVKRAAATLEMSDLLHRRPAQLSGGQRQRVALGRALVREPQVFLFDEPLSNLDAKLRVQMRREIARLHRELGATMVYVTHDQVEAMTLGDRIVVMDRGHVQQVDTPLALYERPANRFVAGFIGTPPMNFLEGVVSGDGTSGLTLELPDVAIRLGGGAPNGRLESLAGRRLVAGLRPEDLALAQAPRPRGSDSIAPLDAMGSDSTPAVSGRLELVEPLGGETLLHVALEGGGQPLIVRVVGRQIPEPDTSVLVKLDLGKVHWFDALSGERV